LTDSSADRVVAYNDTKGNPYEMGLAQLITHVVNHGTHHRAETGMLLVSAVQMVSQRTRA
jgi:uncharacterized damage-inducible protein DinB